MHPLLHHDNARRIIMVPIRPAPSTLYRSTHCCSTLYITDMDSGNKYEPDDRNTVGKRKYRERTLV